MKKFCALAIAALIIALSACGAPKPEDVRAGAVAPFSSADIYGETVDESVFAKAKLTLVNVWATYCGYCLDEMPALAELNTELADKGFQIVGIVSDVGTSQDKQALAVSLAEQTGADYTHILPSPEMADMLSEVKGVPYTFFVDGEGNYVGSALKGARSKETWETIITTRLEELE